MVKVGIIGATGFTGEILTELLLRHPEVEVVYLSAKVEKKDLFFKFVPRLYQQTSLSCDNLDMENKALKSASIIFLSLPHRVSFLYAPLFLKEDKKVIDLSADYRIKDLNIYKKYYLADHPDPDNVKKSIYGLPELFLSKIKKANLIANPGCYPTVTILSLYPLLKENIILTDIIVDAKSGITGAGRHPKIEYHYANINQNIWPYKAFEHQHLPEIIQILSQETNANFKLRFTPHIVGLERGIMVTIYARLKKKIIKEDIREVYEKYYKDARFVRIRDKLPALKDVVYTNFCDIGFEINNKDIVIVGVIDNLLKGASGQAIQNMNILLNLPQETGLI